MFTNGVALGERMHNHPMLGSHDEHSKALSSTYVDSAWPVHRITIPGTVIGANLASTNVETCHQATFFSHFASLSSVSVELGFFGLQCSVIADT